MQRRHLLIGAGLLVVAFAVLAKLAAGVLERDRREMYAAFADDRQRRLEAAALDLGNDVEKIGEDLELSAALVSRSASPGVFDRELHAITAITREYAAIDVRDEAGHSVARVVAPDAPTPTILEEAASAIDDVVAAARMAPGAMKTSRPLAGGNVPLAWIRVFARQSPEHDGLVVAIVVDVRPLLAKLRLVEDDASALLVFGPHGLPAPASDVELADAIGELPGRRRELPGLSALHDAIIEHRGASVVLSDDEATRLGLSNAAAVGVAVPVAIENGEPWALALVSSTVALRSQEQRVVRRILVGGACAVALLVALSAYFVRNARRAARLESQLRQARLEERLVHSEKLATAGQLAAGIAHEIGTPLNIARGRAELAIGRLRDDAAQVAGQRIIIEQIDHVSGLISQLLDYVRSRPPDAEPVDVTDALRATSELLGAEASKRRVRFATSVEPSTPPLRADPGQLRQILVNLAMNSLDACDAGGHVTLRARPAERPSAVVLEVEDDGVGIPPAQHAQVFDPFFTTKKRGQGTGLGLWVVAQLVRSHDADIELSSAPGQGTTVRITWPASTT